MLKKVNGGFNQVQIYKIIPFKLNVQILLKKVKGGQFYKRNPFKRNFRKPQKFAQKFLTEDPIRQLCRAHFSPHIEKSHIFDNF